MPRWIVGVPCWGEQYVRTFIERCLPHHRAALAGYGPPVQYVVHTDEPDRIHVAMSGLPHRCLPLPPGEGYERFGLCHQEVLALAPRESRVSLLGADTIISREFFRAIDARLDEGYKAVCGLGHRTAANEYPAPGISAEALNRWAMQNRHPIIAELFFGSGRSACPSLLFFEKGDSIVMRAFGLGPLGFVKDRYLGFEGTIDADLAANWDRKDLYVVTRPDELACATVDDPARSHGVFPHPLTTLHVAAWASMHTNDLQRWFFKHTIRIQGRGNCGDLEVCDEILRQIPLLEAEVNAWRSLRMRGLPTHGH